MSNFVSSGGRNLLPASGLATFNDVSGNPVAVSAANPLPVDVEVSMTGTQSVIGTGATGAPDATKALAVQGYGYKGTCTITRPANTTPYSAGDVVGGALTIANAGPTSGDVALFGLKLLLQLTAVPSGMTTFRLHLYSVTPPSAIADNSPFTLGSGDYASYLGHIDNITPIAYGTGTVGVQAELDYFLGQFRLGASTNLFAYLVTQGGYTPAANSEVYNLALNGQAP